MTKPLADAHVCTLPTTNDRTELAEFLCHCGRRWYLSWFRIGEGRVAGPSWILEAAEFGAPLWAFVLDTHLLQE